MVASAAAVQFATTLVVVVEVGVNPTSRRPLEVKLRRALWPRGFGDRGKDQEYGCDARLLVAEEEKELDWFNPKRLAGFCREDTLELRKSTDS